MLHKKEIYIFDCSIYITKLKNRINTKKTKGDWVVTKIFFHGPVLCYQSH